MKVWYLSRKLFCQFCGDYDSTHTRYPGSQPGFRSSHGSHVSVIFCLISLQLLSRGEDKGMAHLLIAAFFFNCTATSDAHDDKQQEIKFCQGRCLDDDVLELLVLFVSPPKSWDYRSSNLTIKKRKI